MEVEVNVRSEEAVKENASTYNACCIICETETNYRAFKGKLICQSCVNEAIKM